MSPAATTTARADRLVDLLAERELDSLLISNPVNLRYITGFTGTNGAAVVTPDERFFVTDFRYVEQAAQQVRGFEQLRGQRDLLSDVAARLRGRAGFDDAHMTVQAHAKLVGSVGGEVELVAAAGLVERLRAVKDEGELSAIAAAAELADGVLTAVLDQGLVGRTEREVASWIERELRDRGAEDPAFPAIVAAGAHGALPHALPRDVEIPADTLVVIDWGARVDGYCSDCTRTLATGELDDAASAVYELVRGAQEAALAAVQPGAVVSEVDGVARNLIEAAGHGEHFGHGLGHSVGLEVHEAPRLAKNAEGTLEPGNVITVEPGVYVPGVIGVRIEDLVVVEEGGPRVLSSLPKELITVG